MSVDITKQGLEMDTALRLAGSASALPDGVTPIAGVDESALAYRMARVSGEGGLSIIPASDWGSGVGEPILKVEMGYTSQRTLIGVVDGSKIPGVFITASVMGLNNQITSPSIVVESVSHIGILSFLYILPISINGTVTNYYVPLPPTICNLQFNPGPNCEVNSALFAVYAIRPGVYIPKVSNEILFFAQKSLSVGQNVYTGNIRLPSNAFGSVSLEYVSGTFSGFVTISVASLYSNQIIASSSGLFGGSTAESVGVIFNSINDFTIRINFISGTGSVILNVKGMIEL